MTAPLPVTPVTTPGLRPQGRRILWMASQGYTYARMARVLGISETAARRNGYEANWALGAQNITQAVAIALLRGVIGRWEDCGSHAAYQRHRREKDTPDPACLLAKAEYDRQARRGPGLSDLPPVGEWSWVRAGQHFRSMEQNDDHQRPKVIRILGFESDPEYVQVINIRNGRSGRVSVKRLHRELVTRLRQDRRSGYLLMEPHEVYGIDRE